MSTNKTVEIAKNIIDKCGGDIALIAQWVKLTPKSIYCWKYPRSRGGTGGYIPYKHHAAILAGARKHGYALKKSDFFSLDKN